MPRAKAYDVFGYRDGPNGTKWCRIDTVFYSLSESDGDACEYVKRSLIDHDGYAPNIVVKVSR
jgi:hypothetical protein